MIRYLYGDQLGQHPGLAVSMFRDRAWQFSERLKWPVQVDADGCERDGYDAANPLYVIYQREDGLHGGSMRFLPTTGPVMVNDHFLDLTDGVRIKSPLIWECTRFCIARTGDPAARVSACLMLAAAALGRQFHLDHAVGVFDARMIRIYRALGWPPDVLGSKGKGRAAISVGLWDFKAAPFVDLCARAGVTAQSPADWIAAGFSAGAGGAMALATPSSGG